MDAGNYGPGQSSPQSVAVEAASTAAAPPTPAVPKGDTPKAAAFVVDLIGNGLIAVAAIHPETRVCYGRTFTLPTELDAMSAWIEERQSTHNLHFALNEPVPPDRQQGKAGRVRREDLSTLRGVVVDIDPRPEIEAEPDGLARERERLRGVAKSMIADPCGPSAIIDSGAGLQIAFLFLKPLMATAENIAAVEAQSRALARLYGGDATNDAAHLFRLPGTVNRPNAKKRERGRKPAAAKGTVFTPNRFHTLDSLAALAPPDELEPADPTPPAAFDMSLAWEAAGHPGELPADLVVRLTAARAAHPVLDKLLNAERAEQGGRSDRDFAIACASVEGGMSDRAEVAAIVVAYSPDKFEDEDEHRGSGRAETYLAGTVEKAFTKVARAGPAAMFTPVVDADGAAPAVASKTFGGEDPHDIFGDDDPADLSTPPEGSLPEVVEGYARTEADRIGVPMMFAAAAAVTVAGGAIGNALRIQPRRHDTTYTEPAALWTVLVGPPGCAKSPTTSSAMKPLRDVDKRLMDASEREHRAYEARKAAAGKDNAALVGPPPPWRRATIDDVTPEQQIRMHQQNPRGLMRVVDEYVSFLDFGAYKRTGAGDRGRALQFFDGGSIILDRVSEKRPVRADTALMGLLSSSQPDRIGPMFRDLGVDGLGQRTLFVLWDGVERRFVDRAPDMGALAEYDSAIQALAKIDKTSGGTVRLSEDAQAIFDKVDMRIRRRAHLPGGSAAWEGHISKWGKLLARITLIFHALECWSVTGVVDVREPVTAATMRKAGRFSLSLLDHSWRFYQTNSEPQDRTTASRWIAGWILAHPEMGRFTPRDVERAYKDVRKNRNALVTAMRDLEEAAWVEVSRPAPPGTTGPGEWKVNPEVHRRFAERAVREKAERAAKRAKIDAAVAAQREASNDV
ncbi:DUF3987 domain-containing protein [Methylobacterium sp. J-088]|uniref:DUF3987 domain-containing protein n=1 Tax=Methylobacterium sp. J-088 TaxID=2836664 RepID=UPI001FB87CD8|nr:DUF3987 domain-containing protein [Methylobacterium sp. J-088]MCJ2064405.1 DUF3987 domain-containing protein [Methylobacterium sp. J-088]